MRKIRAGSAAIGLAAVVTWTATSLASSPPEVEYAEPPIEAIDPEDDQTIDETEPDAVDSSESDSPEDDDESPLGPPSMPAGPPKPPSPDDPTDKKDKDGCECGVVGLQSDREWPSGWLSVFALLALSRRRARLRLR